MSTFVFLNITLRIHWFVSASGHVGFATLVTCFTVHIRALVVKAREYISTYVSTFTHFVFAKRFVPSPPALLKYNLIVSYVILGQLVGGMH